MTPTQQNLMKQIRAIAAAPLTQEALDGFDAIIDRDFPQGNGAVFQDDEGNNPLHLACLLRQPHLLQRLLKKVFKNKVLLKQHNHAGLTPLQLVCANSGFDSLSSEAEKAEQRTISGLLLKMLLVVGAPKTIGIPDGPQPLLARMEAQRHNPIPPPLHLACRYHGDDPEFIKLFLGLDDKKRDILSAIVKSAEITAVITEMHQDRFPIYIAARYANFEVIALLMDAHINSLMISRGETSGWAVCNQGFSIFGGECMRLIAEFNRAQVLQQFCEYVPPTVLLRFQKIITSIRDAVVARNQKDGRAYGFTVEEFDAIMTHETCLAAALKYLVEKQTQVLAGKLSPANLDSRLNDLCALVLHLKRFIDQHKDVELTKEQLRACITEYTESAAGKQNVEAIKKSNSGKWNTGLFAKDNYLTIYRQHILDLGVKHLRARINEFFHDVEELSTKENATPAQKAVADKIKEKFKGTGVGFESKVATENDGEPLMSAPSPSASSSSYS